ncbi:MAG: 5-formyltetrahydrofolate cyclo-ligase [Spirochaetaceae bacterium]|jgi:5-formyltetrahydrofolate cyclo-ligase|nr:5-formyltetrahydrofolate cyclo-ligase [Spirochaetaceae bacterium]
MTKKELRKEMKGRLNAVPKEQFTSEGVAAAKRLAGSALWKRHNTVLIYLSMPDELDTSALLDIAFREGKNVYAPKVESDTGMRFFRVTPDPASWVRGAFDIREPAGKEGDAFRFAAGPALVVSPGLAFDRRGNRMGRGKGFYDRFYEKLLQESPDSKICALCMSGAIVDDVPTDEYDRRVDAICTKDEFITIE